MGGREGGIEKERESERWGGGWGGEGGKIHLFVVVLVVVVVSVVVVAAAAAAAAAFVVVMGPRTGCACLPIRELAARACVQKGLVEPPVQAKPISSRPLGLTVQAA